MCERCEDPKPMSKQAQAQAEMYKAMMYGLLNGRQGYGKNYAAASKLRQEAGHERGGSTQGQLICTLDNGKLLVGHLKGKPRTTLPQKVCTYRKPKLYWFGELHGSNNFIHNPSMQRASHWDVKLAHYKLEDFFAEYKDESLEIADSYRGKRFVGISEPTEADKLDQDFLMRFTGDEVTTRTFSSGGKSWVPQGKIFIGGSKPLKINDKSKEIIERVKEIEY